MIRKKSKKKKSMKKIHFINKKFLREMKINILNLIKILYVLMKIKIKSGNCQKKFTTSTLKIGKKLNGINA